MGHSTSQPAHSFHLLGLEEVLFSPYPFVVQPGIFHGGGDLTGQPFQNGSLVWPKRSGILAAQAYGANNSPFGTRGTRMVERIPVWRKV